MDTIDLSVEKFIADQQAISKKQLPASRLKESASVPVVTLCMEPGSGGRLIADEIAKRLNFKLFDKNILIAMANTAAVECVIGSIIGSQANKTFEKETSYILREKR